MNTLYNKSRQVNALRRKWQRQWKLFRNGCLCLTALTITATVSGCDAHQDFPDTAMKVGHVICTDGSIMTADDCEAQGKEPIAVVFHINNSEEEGGLGYAVYLHDNRSEAFADSIGIGQGTSADFSALDGNQNTYALFACTACHSPIAETVYDMWRYGQSAYVPSVAQMRLLYAAKASVNPVIERLGGDLFPDDPDGSWYWTSTEVEGQETAKAWLYSLASGAVQETPKLQCHKVRPVISINE